MRSYFSLTSSARSLIARLSYEERRVHSVSKENSGAQRCWVAIMQHYLISDDMYSLAVMNKIPGISLYVPNFCEQSVECS